MEGISEQTWSIPNEALEPYSYLYLGDLCLVNGWSREALKKFTIVLLLKYVRNSIFSSETLDAYCRCGVALYAEGRSEEGVEFLENTIRIAESQRIQCPARKLEIYKGVLQRMENKETVEDIVDCLE